jgi:hypothetical protein
MSDDTHKHATNAALAVTWEDHRRTRELCDWLGLPLHALTFNASRLRRYTRLIRRTLHLLFQKRPRVVYVQNPSLVLTLLVLATRMLLGRYRVVMDAHNEAVAPFTNAYWPITWLSRVALRSADITIVTNSALAAQVQAIGGRPLVLPDRLPTAPFAPRPVARSQGPLQIMVVATYAADEPIAEIIEAARQLGRDFEFRITGRETKLPAEQRQRLPANVKQTGFLTEHDYWQLMNDSHVVLDLTLKPNCLVCGAYEALALMRPMILSGNAATVDLFGKVALFPATHAASDIALAVKEMVARLDELAAVVAEEGPSFDRRWVERATALKATLAAWSSPPARAPLGPNSDNAAVGRAGRSN